MKTWQNHRIPGFNEVKDNWNQDNRISEVKTKGCKWRVGCLKLRVQRGCNQWYKAVEHEKDELTE